MDSECAFLQLCLFREHWAEIGVEWWHEESHPCESTQGWEGHEKTVEREA